MNTCNQCAKAVQTADCMKCISCKNQVHLSCAKLTTAVFKRMSEENKESWICAKCKTGQSPLSTSNLNSVDSSILLSEIKKLSSQLHSMNSKLVSFEQTIVHNNTTIEDFTNKIRVLEEKLKKMDKLEDEVMELKKFVTYLDKSNNEKEQQLLINNIEIFGLTESKDENLTASLIKIASNVGQIIKEEDIEYISRPNPRQHSQDGIVAATRDARPRNVVAKFISKRKKDELLAAIKKKKGVDCKSLGVAGGKLFVNDHLTKKNKVLLRSAKEFKNINNYNFLWVRNSKIYLRKNVTSPAILVSSQTLLNNLT